MLGALIGDIVGSRFEFNNIKTKVFDFLTYRCFVTDESIMSLAIAKAIIDCKGDLREVAAIYHRTEIVTRYCESDILVSTHCAIPEDMRNKIGKFLK